MSILVTGSSGFIGTALCSFFLKKKITFYALDKKKMVTGQKNFILCNLLDKDKLYNILKKIRPKYILQLAARTDLHGLSVNDYKENYLGTKNLIECTNQINSVKRIIFFSTLLVNKVGYAPKNLQDYNPDTNYGKSKVMMEKIIKKATIKSDWCIVRPTTIWGPNINNHFAQFIKLIKRGLYFNIANKKTLKNYGYIENTVFQIFKLIYSEYRFFNKKIYYLADYTSLCLEDWADQISIIYKKKINFCINYKIVKFFSILGDILQKFKISNFPLNSRRLSNMTTDLIVNVSDLNKVCGKLPVSLKIATYRFARSFNNENKL